MDYCRIFQLRVAGHAIEFSACPKERIFSIRLVDYECTATTIASEAATPEELEGIIGELQELLSELN